MSVIGTAVVMAAAVVVGTVLQRLSGTGVGLVVAPVLSLLLGPAYGVLITNMTTAVSGFLIMLTVWAHIHWGRFWLIIPAAVIGAWPGAWLVGQLSAAWLSIILGSIVLAALALTVSLPQLPRWTGRAPGILAGFLGGFFNTTSGVAAPVMVIYSRLSRWDQRSFAATLQPTFMTMGLVSVVSKLVLDTVEDDSEITISLFWAAPVIVSAVLLGVGLGTWLARWVSFQAARTMAMALAGMGGAAAIIRGAAELVLG